MGIEDGFYFPERGVQLEDGFFEVVAEMLSPGIDGLADDVAEGHSGFMGCAQCKSLSGTDMDAGIDEDKAVVAEIEGDRFELFPAAATEAGYIEDEEGAIAAQLSGVVEEAGGIETEMELFV